MINLLLEAEDEYKIRREEYTLAEEDNLERRWQEVRLHSLRWQEVGPHSLLRQAWVGEWVRGSWLCRKQQRGKFWVWRVKCRSTLYLFRQLLRLEALFVTFL
jgi:hypothetical protein